MSPTFTTFPNRLDWRTGWRQRPSLTRYFSAAQGRKQWKAQSSYAAVITSPIIAPRSTKSPTDITRPLHVKLFATVIDPHPGNTLDRPTKQLSTDSASRCLCNVVTDDKRDVSYVSRLQMCSATDLTNMWFRSIGYESITSSHSPSWSQTSNIQ